MAGFIDALREGGGWDLDRRLIARPFPQSLPGQPTPRAKWSALRSELARQSGVFIVLGGMKMVDGQQVMADGVLEEFEMAKEAGAFLLPVGSTGGAAKQISDQLLGSDISSTGADAQRPTDKEIAALSDISIKAETILSTIEGILNRVAKAT